MSEALRLEGARFGRLHVIERVPLPGGVKKPSSYWRCLCDCGNSTITQGKRLTLGVTKSCGCLRIKHGMAKKRVAEYNIWLQMKGRCTNPNNPEYRNYGGRGIKVCSQWLTSFKTFLDDVGFRPAKHLTLDRKNNDGHYEPDNIRWATKSQQNFNRRKPRLLCRYSDKELLAEVQRRGLS